MYTELELLLEKLHLDPNNSDLFNRLLVEAIILLGIDEKELAWALSTSRTIINHWKSGRSIPHPLVRDLVIREIRARLSELDSTTSKET